MYGTRNIYMKTMGVWIHVLGCMKFEYSFVWKLWEYGSLVLD